ncbi:cache domain-containing sensor histidine kinase [Halobacillus naozhouensis]|uniref:Histidine kinase n=1 Tax=Halobacillus naozhouensis TaxID=554880 RepID=A0ABY8IZJ6_9BACI|nr:histidine kinase [Halobacillus naozhouensis]WFT75674.1 histidine kinase [Halobacillus naozhouensis]
MFKHWGLKKQFASVFFILITLPTVLFGALIYIQTTNTFKNQAEMNTIDLLDKNEESLTSVIRGIESMSSYMIYDENFRTFFTTGKEDMTSAAYKRAEEGIRGYFTFQITSQDYIDSIYLQAKDGHTLSFGNPTHGDERQLTAHAKKASGAIHWSNAYPVISAWDGEKHIISLTRQINDLDNITKPIGLVRIRLDEQDLFDAYSTGTSNQQGNFFVMSEDGEVVLHQDETMLGESFPNKRIVDLVVESDTNSTRYVTDDNSYLVVKKPITDTDWFSVAIVDEDNIVGELYQVRTLIAGMIVLLILLGVLAFIGFYRFNVKRIIELTNQTQQLETGDFSATVKITSHDEIGQLGMRFNHMVQEIREYIDKEYKLKIKQRESELKSLQNQMDPHFLYNTLDMIRWTARIEKAMKTGEQIEHLSKIFRINLNQGKTWITLNEEIDYIRSYLDLQKNRLGDRMDYSIEVDPSLSHALLLKQLLQPLIENSIIHGFHNLNRSGTIHIYGQRTEGQLWIDVIDNGHGLDKDFTFKQEGSYALYNLEERIRIACGPGYGLENIPCEKGAWMRLKLPFIMEQQKNSLEGKRG